MVIREITLLECPWLNRTYEIGETVFRFHGRTYSCIGNNGTAFCKEIDKTPFFELPNDAVSVLK